MRWGGRFGGREGERYEVGRGRYGGVEGDMEVWRGEQV